MWLINRKNLIPLVPHEYGVAGIFRGATSSFFGYIGYDEICCIAGEAINPKVNLPRAVMFTLALVTCMYMAAAVSLTGMQPYTEISRTSGFPYAFQWNGAVWMAQITAVSEEFAPLKIAMNVANTVIDSGNQHSNTCFNFACFLVIRRGKCLSFQVLCSLPSLHSLVFCLPLPKMDYYPHSLQNLTVQEIYGTGHGWQAL